MPPFIFFFLFLRAFDVSVQTEHCQLLWQITRCHSASVWSEFSSAQTGFKVLVVSASSDYRATISSAHLHQDFSPFGFMKSLKGHADSRVWPSPVSWNNLILKTQQQYDNVEETRDCTKGNETLLLCQSFSILFLTSCQCDRSMNTLGTVNE